MAPDDCPDCERLRTARANAYSDADVAYAVAARAASDARAAADVAWSAAVDAYHAHHRSHKGGAA